MEQYLTFLTNKQQFAIEIGSINKIIDYIEPTKLPESLDYLVGVIKHNDNILPIISLSKRLFDVDSQESELKRIVVINWNDKQIGYEVDEIVGIKNFRQDEIEIANPELGLTKDYICGYVKNEKEVIIILDNLKVLTGKTEDELLTIE